MILQIYDRFGNLLQEKVKVLNKDFTFSNILGSGQTSLRLQLEYKNYDLLGKFIKFFVKERLVYSGQIVNEDFNFNGITEIECYGLYDLFNYVYSTKNYDTYVANINYLVNKIKTNFSFLNGKIITSNIEDSVLSITSSSGTSIINSIVKESGNDFFINQFGEILFDENISNKEHFITIGNNGEIVKGNIGRSLKGYVSYVQGIDTTNNVNTYIIDEETEKIFGRSEIIVKASGQYDNHSMIKTIKDKIKTPPKKTQIEVKGDFWKYQVGDYITIENSAISFEKVKIVKIDFSYNKAVLYLDDFSNIYKNLK